MSRRKGSNSPSASGHRNPPAEHRFKPGQSGNPKGRPKKPPRPGKLNPLEQAFQDAFIEEGNRLVTLPDGGVQRTMSASQWVLRSTFISAIKGNALAQRSILLTSLEIERRAQTAHSELLRQALELKVSLEEHRREQVKMGAREESILIHPADIEIDPETLDVRIYAPVTMEQVKARRECIAARDECIAWLARGEATLAEDGPDELVQFGLEFAREQLTRFNEVLPPRLRRWSAADEPPKFGQAIAPSTPGPARSAVAPTAPMQWLEAEPPADDDCQS
jgi:hypothetical protein